MLRERQPLLVVPTVGQQNAADVEENRAYLRHVSASERYQLREAI